MGQIKDNMLKSKQSIKDGYEKFVIKNPEGCWDWSGCCPENPGYGQFRSNMKIYRAHRASWAIHFGEIPKGMLVLHKCDNRRCSNPEHLFLGTKKDNTHDMINKGRNTFFGAKGTDNHRAKLSIKAVKMVKRLLKDGFKSEKIASKLKVPHSTIRNIKYNYTWKGAL